MTRIQRLKTNQFKTETLPQDASRLFEELRDEFTQLAGLFRERLYRDKNIITASTTRPVLKFGQMPLVDTLAGDVDLRLPEAKPRDAGRVLGFVKRYADGFVSVQTGDGSAINGHYQRAHGFTQAGMHEFLWDGSGWWFQEPTAHVRAHSDRLRPLGLWQFSADSLLTDSSGNSYTLTVETGTERYTRINTHLHAFFFDGATSLWHNAAVAALRITGDVTFMCLWVLDTAVALAPWVSHLASGEGEAQNILYRFGFTSGTYGTQWLTESGAGVDSSYSIDSHMSPPGQLCHVAVTRTSDVIQMYQQGRTFGDASTALTTPTGGADGRHRLGSTGSTHIRGAMASAVLYNRALSAQEIRDEYHYTMGQAHGFITEFP